MSEGLGLEIIERDFRQAFLNRSSASPITADKALEAWGADPSKLESGQAFVGLGILGKGMPLPIHILTKDLDLGTPSVKWLRRVTMTGRGVCMIRVTVDGVLKISSRVTLEHFAGGTKWLAFPRGTSGRRIRLEIWGDIGQIQNPVIDWSPIGVPMEQTNQGEEA